MWAVFIYCTTYLHIVLLLLSSHIFTKNIIPQQKNLNLYEANSVADLDDFCPNPDLNNFFGNFSMEFSLMIYILQNWFIKQKV
jgi:hypothetical protein